MPPPEELDELIKNDLETAVKVYAAKLSTKPLDTCFRRATR